MSSFFFLQSRVLDVQVEDVLFAAGEALSFIWGEIPVTPDIILKSNYSSLSLSSNYLTGDVPTTIAISSSCDRYSSDDPHSTAREMIIRKLFDNLLFSSRKEERCAGAVWLVSLTMYCGRHPKIQLLLPEIQVSSRSFVQLFFDHFYVNISCFPHSVSCTRYILNLF